MKANLFNMMVCSKCKQELRFTKKQLICKNKHSFDVRGNVPIMVKLDDYLEIEAHAWEDEWQKKISKASLEAYQKNMKVFDKMGFWEESASSARLIPSKDNFNVLDLGCGNGASTANIKGQLVVGLDLSEKQLIKAKKRFPKREFVVGDARNLPFKNNSFDLIIAINMLHHVNDPENVLKDCFRVLKKGGKLLTVDPNLYNPIGFMGRGLFRLLRLKSIFPTFPQFALGEEENQYTKKQYYALFQKSPFKTYKIKPHRIERLFFFASILIPAFSKIPYYDHILMIMSKLGNNIVKYKPFDNICYFWKGEAIK